MKNNNSLLKVFSYEAINNVVTVLFGFLVITFSTKNVYTDIILVYSWVAIAESIVRLRQENNYIRVEKSNLFSPEKITLYFYSTYISFILLSVLYFLFKYTFNNIQHINEIFIFTAINLILTTLTYSNNIVGKHDIAIKLQLTWSGFSLIFIILNYILFKNNDITSLLYIRIISLILVIICYRECSLVFFKTIFSSNIKFKITNSLIYFKKNIYIANIFSGITFSSPLLIIEYFMGREFVSTIAITKQVSDMVYKFIPNAITPYLIEKISSDKGDRIYLFYNKNKYFGILAIIVLFFILITSIPYVNIILGKVYNSNYINDALINLISFFTILSNFIAVIYISKRLENLLNKYYIYFYFILSLSFFIYILIDVKMRDSIYILSLILVNIIFFTTLILYKLKSEI